MRPATNEFDQRDQCKDSEGQRLEQGVLVLPPEHQQPVLLAFDAGAHEGRVELVDVDEKHIDAVQVLAQRGQHDERQHDRGRDDGEAPRRAQRPHEGPDPGPARIDQEGSDQAHARSNEGRQIRPDQFPTHARSIAEGKEHAEFQPVDTGRSKKARREARDQGEARDPLSRSTEEAQPDQRAEKRQDRIHPYGRRETEDQACHEARRPAALPGIRGGEDALDRRQDQGQDKHMGPDRDGKARQERRDRQQAGSPGRHHPVAVEIERDPVGQGHADHRRQRIHEDQPANATDRVEGRGDHAVKPRILRREPAIGDMGEMGFQRRRARQRLVGNEQAAALDHGAGHIDIAHAVQREGSRHRQHGDDQGDQQSASRPSENPTPGQGGRAGVTVSGEQSKV